MLLFSNRLIEMLLCQERGLIRSAEPSARFTFRMIVECAGCCFLSQYYRDPGESGFTFSLQLHLMRCRRKRLLAKNLCVKTNWGKSQLPPEIFTADCLPLLRGTTSKNTSAQCQHWGRRLRSGKKPL